MIWASSRLVLLSERRDLLHQHAIMGFPLLLLSLPLGLGLELGSCLSMRKGSGWQKMKRRGRGEEGIGVWWQKGGLGCGGRRGDWGVVALA